MPAQADALAWLQAQGQAGAAALLAAAGGSPLEALAWAQEGLSPALLAALPRRVSVGDASALIGRPLPRVIELLLKLAHDAQMLAAGGVPRFFAASPWPTDPDLAALRQWQQALLRAARHDEHPWNAGLLVESLVTQAKAVWPGTAARPAQPGQRAGASIHSDR
jgi:DNA polymerase-3 subunit delta'